MDSTFFNISEERHERTKFVVFFFWGLYLVKTRSFPVLTVSATNSTSSYSIVDDLGPKGMGFMENKGQRYRGFLYMFFFKSATRANFS